MSVVLAAVLMSACSSGDSEPEAAPATSLSPTTSPTPTVPPQEPTKYGTNAIISNWDEYYDDPVVQAYRDWRIARTASIIERKLVPEFEDSMTPDYGDTAISQTRLIWSRDWTTAPEGRLTIESVKTNGTKASVLSCELSPSLALKNADGSFVHGPDAQGRVKVETTLTSADSGRAWLVDAFEQRGDC